MPRGDPFSQLCQLTAALAQPIAADLHTHTLASDGGYTPSQVLAFAQQAKLKAVAITDHDTLAGYDDASKLDSPVKLIPGVELTTLWASRETHLLAYAFDPADDDLRKLLRHQCELRRERFRTMVEALRAKGIELELGELLHRTPSVGRGHLAKLLTQAGRSARELFGGITIPNTPFIEISTAIGMIHHAGGIASLAHPRDEMTLGELEELKLFGIDAIEIDHPRIGSARRGELSSWAERLDLLATGGSDCHGPGSNAIGSHGVRMAEWQKLERR